MLDIKRKRKVEIYLEAALKSERHGERIRRTDTRSPDLSMRLGELQERCLDTVLMRSRLDE